MNRASSNRRNNAVVLTVHIPKDNVLNEAAIETFRQTKRDRLAFLLQLEQR